MRLLAAPDKFRGTLTARQAAAAAEGARKVVVAVGGVASTDGGVGAVEALPAHLPPLEVACDVEARFLDAADVFAPQKGATTEQVRIL